MTQAQGAQVRLAVVTGSDGFIGRHLVEALQAAGWQVRGYDLLKGWDAANLTVDDLDRVDVVFHLAARPGVRSSWDEFPVYLKWNVVTTQRVFAACAQAGVRCVYASSSSVYGNLFAGGPTAEYMPRRPASPYGATKVMVEALASAYQQSFDFDAVGLRYFTVYGPRQRPDMAFARWIDAVRRGDCPVIFGDGSQRRDFTYVDDAVAGTLAAAESGLTGRVYNICSGEAVTVGSAAEQFYDACRVVSDGRLRRGLVRVPIFSDRRPGDVAETWGDKGLAAIDLGYSPAVDLRSGLERQIRVACDVPPA